MNDKKDTITFKFDGANISTDALGGSLLPLADHVYNLVQACSEEEARLVSIENNCVKMTFARTVAAVMLTFAGTSLDGVKDPAKYNLSAKAINAMLVKRNATLEIADGSGRTVCRFNGKTALPSMPEVHHDIKATMAIYGELTDVGGIEQNVHVQCELVLHNALQST